VGKTTVTKSRPKFNVAALLEEEDKTEDGRALVINDVTMITDRIYMFDTVQLYYVKHAYLYIIICSMPINCFGFIL